MALSPRLDLRQSQQLVMTPQLQQAIKLLQLNNIELSGFLADEVEKNPLLEVGADRSEEGDRSREKEAPDSAENTAETPALDDSMSNHGENALDADFTENAYDGDTASDRMGMDDSAGAGLSLTGSGAVTGSGGAIGGDDNILEETVSSTLSLQDFLSEQMALVLKVPEDKFIASHLIDLVDEAGYIHETLEDVADRLGCDLEDVEAVLTELQTLEPTGVFARSLGECLKLQQRERDRLDPAMNIFLDHLDLVAKRDMPALKRLCSVDEDDLADMIREIQTLNPRPGLAYGGASAQVVEPDVYVKRSKDGIWHVELNTQTLPRVLVNQRYFSQMNSNSKDKKAKMYLSDCLGSANWLVKALDQRAQTILKVSTELVRQQEAFFEKGVRYLKPLNLRVIAEEIGMHESTVSRVTSNKYLFTDRGMYELKYFFTSAISSSEGEAMHSAEAVRDRIKTLIDDEDVKKILSDDAIVDKLQTDGVEIARRTVAKYREAMNIPSSVQRRRLKKIAV